MNGGLKYASAKNGVLAVAHRNKCSKHVSCPSLARHMQSPPADFLGTMEEYVKDARGNPARAGPTGAGTNTLPSVNHSSSIARQGGATSGAITGVCAGQSSD